MIENSTEALQKRTIEIYKRVWEKACPDTEVDLETVSLFARFYDWEFAMDWIQRNADKFSTDTDVEISDAKAFYNQFCVFLEAAYKTDAEKVRGEYLRELLSAKNLWLTPDKDYLEEVYEDRDVPVIVREGVPIASFTPIKKFWNYYVIKKDKMRKVRKREEVFWLAMAWVYYFGNTRQEPSALNIFDELKIVLTSKKNDKDINEVVRWCIGCWMDMLPDNQTEGSYTEKGGLIDGFGRYEYLGGVFDFSEYFRYKENHIEEMLAWELEKVLKKDVSRCLVGTLCDNLEYVEKAWQKEGEDFGDKNDMLKGIRFPISKKDRRPKHKGDEPEPSEYMGGTLKGMGEYFKHNQSLKGWLVEPELRALNEVMNEETAEICRKIVVELNTYSYRKFICDLFIRMWPSKETYFSVVGVQYMLRAIGETFEAAEDLDFLKEVQTMYGIAIYLDMLCDKFGEGIITEGDGAEEAYDKMLDAMYPFYSAADGGHADDREDDETAEEIDGKEDGEIIKEIMKIMIDASIIAVNSLKMAKVPQMTRRFRREGKHFKFDRDMAIACLYDIFDLCSE